MLIPLPQTASRLTCPHPRSGCWARCWILAPALPIRENLFLMYKALSKIMTCVSQKKNPHAQALGALGGKARTEKLQGLRVSRLQDAVRSQRKPLLPANANEHSSKERGRANADSQARGQVIRIGDRWYVRYWERRNIGGTIERKRVTHRLGPVTTRGKSPPAEIVAEAERHMHRRSTTAA